MKSFIVPCSFSVAVDLVVKANSPEEARAIAERNMRPVMNDVWKDEETGNEVLAADLGYIDDSFIVPSLEAVEEIDEDEFDELRSGIVD